MIKKMVARGGIEPPTRGFSVRRPFKKLADFTGKILTQIIDDTQVNALRFVLVESIDAAVRMNFGVIDSDQDRIYTGPDLFGNGISYGRYLYGIRHVYGEAFKLWSREAVIDDSFTLVCTWQFWQSQKEKYTTCGVLRWEQGDMVLDAQYVQ